MPARDCPRATGTLAELRYRRANKSAPSIQHVSECRLSNFAFGATASPDTFPSPRRTQSNNTKTRSPRSQDGIRCRLEPMSISGRPKALPTPFRPMGCSVSTDSFPLWRERFAGVSAVSDLADMELGYPSGGEFTKNAIVTNLVGGRWISAFAQDSFRIKPRFTVQYGLRWEYRRQPMDTHNQIATFFPLSKTYAPGDGLLLTALPDEANDALCSNPYFISSTGECLVMTSGMRKEKGLTGNKVRQVSFGPGAGYFAPRMGLSWQPLQTDRLVLHAGAASSWIYQTPIAWAPSPTIIQCSRKRRIT